MKMKFVKYILLALFIISFIAGCESKEEIERAKQAEIFKQEQIKKLKEEKLLKEQEVKKAQELAKIEAKEREEALLTAQREKNTSIMSNLGLSMGEGKIILDMNRAKEFFGNLHHKLIKVDRELTEGNLTITKPAGIEIEEKKVTIDLNKTETYLDSWGKKMKKFTIEFDNFTKSLYSDEKNSTKEQY